MGSRRAVNGFQTREVRLDTLYPCHADLAQLVEHLVEAQGARVQILESEPGSISSMGERRSDKALTEDRNLDRVPMAYSLTVERLSYKQVALGQHQLGRPSVYGAEVARAAWAREAASSILATLTNAGVSASVLGGLISRQTGSVTQSRNHGLLVIVVARRACNAEVRVRSSGGPPI